MTLEVGADNGFDHRNEIDRCIAPAELQSGVQASCRRCWPPAETTWPACAIAPYSALPLPAAAAVAAKSPRPRWRICARYPRADSSIDWSRARRCRTAPRSAGAPISRSWARLDAAQLTEGALFRRVWGNRVGPALSDRAIALITQRRAALAGLEGDFGGHSLRSGFVTEGAR